MWEAFQIAAKDVCAHADWRTAGISTDQWTSSYLAMRADDIGGTPEELQTQRGFSSRTLRSLRKQVCESGCVKKTGVDQWRAA
jgi:hypothetical protein